MMKYWFTEDKRAYCEGTQEDLKKLYPNAIEVSKCPGAGYTYFFDTKIWEKTINSTESSWMNLRNEYLRNTYWLIGSDSPLKREEAERLKVWRVNLMKMFEQAPDKIQKPVYPEYIKQWI